MACFDWCSKDSLVHCFFIEAEQIQQLRQSDPSIEVFLWQESALVIARLLLPQIFEKLAMHQIRILIAERSTLNMYTKGEHIEVERNNIGILLEGFLKTKSQNLITPPAVLLPSNANLTLFGLESSDYCYIVPGYQVEARARIIIFDIGRLSKIEADFRRTASLLSQTDEPPQRWSREHSGQLSWPENFWKTRGPRKVRLDEIRSQPGSLYTRAVQLSMYGSLMDGMHPGQDQRQQLHHRMQTEGFNKKRMPAPIEAGEAATSAPVTQLRSKAMEDDSSSDGYAGEEVVVRVDSPSALSFLHFSSSLHSRLLQDN